MDTQRYPTVAQKDLTSPREKKPIQTADLFPTLIRWIRLHGFDIVTIICVAAITLGIHSAPPAPNRSFPVFGPNGAIVYPEFSLPRKKQIIPIWASAMIAILVPLMFFGIFQIRRRSLTDLLTSFLGIVKSVLTAALLQVFIKCLIGGLRPHFYDACKPEVPTAGEGTGTGFAHLMYDQSICTGENKEHIKDAVKSMPSGHSAAAWGGLLFLSLYFNAQLKLMSGHNPAYWKMILVFAPLLGATLMSLALILDNHHHWEDVVVGSAIGCATALVSFRQTFAAIWDHRFNHILLPRATSVFHPQPYIPVEGRGESYTYKPMAPALARDLPFTREGGWGEEVGGPHFAGAPGDASALATTRRGVKPLEGAGQRHGNGGPYPT
ncbi:lipid phosphate phosphatase 1 [Coprinopsis sp. MPI-PUGE-AT-0042]|nr:lipid phosphate phosphatase 1 [Coprinopsis sp. MPI-PUGE-AT-0042]